MAVNTLEPAMIISIISLKTLQIEDSSNIHSSSQTINFNKSGSTDNETIMNIRQD